MEAKNIRVEKWTGITVSRPDKPYTSEQLDMDDFNRMVVSPDVREGGRNGKIVGQVHRYYVNKDGRLIVDCTVPYPCEDLDIWMDPDRTKYEFYIQYYTTLSND